MHPYLSRLGVRPEVQEYFRLFYCADDLGNLIFPHGDVEEHFGFAFHRLPLTDDCWLAGNLCFPQVRRVILSASALDAVSWLNKKYDAFTSTQNLLFVALGTGISEVQLDWIRGNFSAKKCQLIFSNDLLGRLADLKVAAALRGWPLSVYADAEEKLIVNFRTANFCFRQDALSLSAFERAAGVRFGVSAPKPRSHHSFFEELKAEAGLLI
nr:hypothetical protein [uncultured Mucilaginibacter sp.]